MIRIPEEWAGSFRDFEVFQGETFDIFVNPNTKEWREIYNQSRINQIPVRFSFVAPANVLYVGAIPFHADLTDQARKDYGPKQRGKIEGIVDPIEGEYAIKSSPRITDTTQQAFYDTIFYKKILSQYRQVDDVGTMAGEIN